MTRHLLASIQFIGTTDQRGTECIRKRLGFLGEDRTGKPSAKILLPFRSYHWGKNRELKKDRSSGTALRGCRSSRMPSRGGSRAIEARRAHSGTTRALVETLFSSNSANVGPPRGPPPPLSAYEARRKEVISNKLYPSTRSRFEADKKQ